MILPFLYSAKTSSSTSQRRKKKPHLPCKTSQQKIAFTVCDAFFFSFESDTTIFFSSLSSHITWCLLCFGPLATSSNRTILLCCNSISTPNTHKKKQEMIAREIFVQQFQAALSDPSVHLMLKANRTFTSAPKNHNRLEDYRCCATMVLRIAHGFFFLAFVWPF